MQSHEIVPSSSKMTNKPIFWVTVLAVALVSYMLGYANDTRYDNLSANQSNQMTEEQDIAAVKRLNEIDKLIIANLDTAVGISGESVGVAGAVFGKWNSLTIADITNATVSVQQHSVQIQALTPQTDALREQRANLLRELAIE